MDRNLYSSSFRPERQLNWQCPTCEQGLLRIKIGTFSSSEISRSEKAYSHPEWCPDWVDLLYSCIFKCQNEHCGESVASSGIGFLDLDIVEDEHGENRQEYFPYLNQRALPHH